MIHLNVAVDGSTPTLEPTVEIKDGQLVVTASSDEQPPATISVGLSEHRCGKCSYWTDVRIPDSGFHANCEVGKCQIILPFWAGEKEGYDRSELSAFEGTDCEMFWPSTPFTEAEDSAQRAIDEAYNAGREDGAAEYAKEYRYDRDR